MTLSQPQTQAIKTLIRTPNARINKNVMTALEKRGLVKEGTVSTSGYHAVDLFKNCPQIPVPTDNMIAEYAGKSVILEEWFDGETEIAAIYGWSTTGPANIYTLDAHRILLTYRDYVLAVNRRLSETWGKSYDHEFEWRKGDFNGLSQHMIKEASNKVLRDHEFFGYYTSDIYLSICKALVEGKPDNTQIASSSHKYSFEDTEDEVTPFLCILPEAKRLHYEFFK